MLISTSVLQPDNELSQGWCPANFMKINIRKISVIAFTMKTNALYYVYKIRHRL
jgi:hypothetical protein